MWNLLTGRGAGSESGVVSAIHETTSVVIHSNGASVVSSTWQAPAVKPGTTRAVALDNLLPNLAPAHFALRASSGSLPMYRLTDAGLDLPRLLQALQGDVVTLMPRAVGAMDASQIPTLSGTLASFNEKTLTLQRIVEDAEKAAGGGRNGNKDDGAGHAARVVRGSAFTTVALADLLERYTLHANVDTTVPHVYAVVRAGSEGVQPGIGGPDTPPLRLFAQYVTLDLSCRVEHYIVIEPAGTSLTWRTNATVHSASRARASGLYVYISDMPLAYQSETAPTIAPANRGDALETGGLDAAGPADCFTCLTPEAPVEIASFPCTFPVRAAMVLPCSYSLRWEVTSAGVPRHPHRIILLDHEARPDMRANLLAGSVVAHRRRGGEALGADLLGTTTLSPLACRASRVELDLGEEPDVSVQRELGQSSVSEAEGERTQEYVMHICNVRPNDVTLHVRDTLDASSWQFVSASDKELKVRPHARHVPWEPLRRNVGEFMLTVSAKTTIEVRYIIRYLL